jgi:hypothetical protein
MNRSIAIAVVAALLLGAGWFAFRRDHSSMVQGAPIAGTQAAQSVATSQSNPAAEVVAHEPAPSANISSRNKSVEPARGSLNSLMDSTGRVLEEPIQSKLDGSLLRKLYSYDEGGNVAREMYLDPRNGRIIECKTHFVDADGRTQVRITAYDGRELQASAVQ